MCRELHPARPILGLESSLSDLVSITYYCCNLWFLICFYEGTCGLWGKGSCHLVTIALGSTPIQTAPKKHSMLPLLVVLFLISYGLLALLVVEQDRTIANQRSLINQVMGDSMELTALKTKLSRQQHPGARSQAPSTHVNPQDQGSVKQRKLVPLKPPKDAADTPDRKSTRLN